MAQYIDIFIDQGSSYSQDIPLVDPNGLPTDLTDYSVRGQIRRSYTSTDAVDFSATVSGDPTNGLINISLTPQQTAALKQGRSVFDIEIFIDASPETSVIRVREGQAHVTPRVTQP